MRGRIAKLMGLVLAVSLSFGMMSASAYPVHYGSQDTAAHGWIVFVHNDRAATVHAVCHWNADGSRWTWKPNVGPDRRVWTTSDAGSWGNHMPRNLVCTYTV